MPNVIQDWVLQLPMQQQSVLMLALRGPDDISKYHESKRVVRYYRSCVLKAARYGRPLVVDEEADTFMSMGGFSDDKYWHKTLDRYFGVVDCLPHHYHMHLMHGAQIVGYKHPDKLFQRRWFMFYVECCNDLHLGPETCEQMDIRLGDWGREHWE